MTTVTGKYQITLPKRLVDAFGIQVGDEVELVASGEAISIVPARAMKAVLTPEQRVRLFDQATSRQHARQQGSVAAAPADRGWTREDLYTRGRPR